MRQLSDRNFGLVIAYLVPGFIALWGLKWVDPEIGRWLDGPAGEGPTVAGFLYVTLACVGLGMTMNALRWALIDTIHEHTGLRRPRWSDQMLHERVEGYIWLVENHYRHYQFYGNSLVALFLAAVLRHASLSDAQAGFGWLDASVLILALVFFATSRSCLARYYRRTAILLDGEDGSMHMANGGHHEKPAPSKPPAKPEPQDQSKAEQAKK